ncbi:RNA-binding domain-containing protein [Heliocybe sulcata]|uniref:Probable RNA-binding protein 18 n=1 Tax=Heliocybe sulcata TaxID=5364 RepID=A0A5C3MSD2_9AGAM|nr:RNA-binding domain-containing protein [Heliocybe sulcata]
MSSSPDSASPVPGPSRTLPESHLSYPAEQSTSAAPKPTAQPRQVLKDRLYVGNLHPTVDEHALIKVFSKFGKISKLDYLFHKTGLLKGKPRGYVFIEYANPEDAATAITSAHDKVLRGRKLVVTYATQAPLNDPASSSSKYRKGALEANRPTTLSLLKTSVTSSRNDTNDKIAKLEAKLRQMERQDANSSGVASSSSLSLPMKPSPAVTVPAFAAQAYSTSSSMSDRIRVATSSSSAVQDSKPTRNARSMQRGHRPSHLPRGSSSSLSSMQTVKQTNPSSLSRTTAPTSTTTSGFILPSVPHGSGRLNAAHSLASSKSNSSKGAKL